MGLRERERGGGDTASKRDGGLREREEEEMQPARGSEG